MAKKTNDYGFEEFEGGHGKKQNQKLKPYLVQRYLLPPYLSGIFSAPPSICSDCRF